jgi:CBS-domain-containing membrane protein
MGVLSGAREWDLDLDRYLNRIIPPSPLHRLPTSVSRFLGYRKTQRQDVGNVLGALWSMLGAFCGLVVIAVLFKHTEAIQWHHPPALIASFVRSSLYLGTINVADRGMQGASAILEYNAIRSPLGQPRNALLGHTFSALIGVGISKLFQYHSDYDSIQWIAGAVGCGIASAVMLLTNTVHPPGGASAVLAATDPVIRAMGWYFVGLVMWGTTLMVIVGLIINNIQRQFPIYWWTPMDLKKAKKEDEETVPDAKGGVEKKQSDGKEEYRGDNEMIQITGAEVSLPDDLSLNAEETRVLEELRARIMRRADERKCKNSKADMETTDSSSGRSSTDFTMVTSRSDESRSGSLCRDKKKTQE